MFRIGVMLFGALQVGFGLYLLTMLPVWADASIAATVATALSLAMEYSG